MLRRLAEQHEFSTLRDACLDAGLDDPVFDVNVTPNRQDCMGVRGIARDLAAAGALGHIAIWGRGLGASAPRSAARSQWMGVQRIVAEALGT